MLTGEYIYIYIMQMHAKIQQGQKSYITSRLFYCFYLNIASNKPKKLRKKTFYYELKDCKLYAMLK